MDFRPLKTDERQKLIDGHCADVFGVHPLGLVVGPFARIVFGKIEDGV